MRSVRSHATHRENGDTSPWGSRATSVQWQLVKTVGAAEGPSVGPVRGKNIVLHFIIIVLVNFDQHVGPGQ